MEITREAAGASHAIRRVIEDAFGRTAEADLVDALRADGDLVISLTAVSAGEVCGYVALSRLRSPDRALALAPLAVVKSQQRRGVGSLLVRHALELARGAGEDIVFVLGYPAYYGRIGFSVELAEAFASPYAGAHFMALRVSQRTVAAAPVIYARAFDGLG